MKMKIFFHFIVSDENLMLVGSSSVEFGSEFSLSIRTRVHAYFVPQAKIQVAKVSLERMCTRCNATSRRKKRGGRNGHLPFFLIVFQFNLHNLSINVITPLQHTLNNRNSNTHCPRITAQRH